MMKKFILLLIPLVFVLGGCKNGLHISTTEQKTTTATTIPNQEEVDAFKALLNEQDLSDFYQKWFASVYSHEYSILDIENIELEDETIMDYGKSTNFYNYSGYGFLDFYYILSEDNYNSLMDSYGTINIFDAMSKGEGGYRIMQSSDAASYNKYVAEESKSVGLSVNQSMALKTTESDVIVDNTLYISDRNAFEYEKRQEFGGMIDKELLFSTVSTRSFREIFSTVNLFGAPEDIEYLDSLYYSTCKNLKNKNDKEISDFIIDKKIEISEGEKYLEVNFSFDGEELEDNDSIPGIIKGTLYYDKETHAFAEFQYVVEFINESINEETGDIIFANMKFTCSGKISRDSIGSIYTKEDLTVYDDVVTFLEDVREKVVPPSIYQ